MEGYARLDPMSGTCSIFHNDGGLVTLAAVPADGRYPMGTTSQHLVEFTLEPLEAAYRSAETCVRVCLSDFRDDTNLRWIVSWARYRGIR
jgi:hypothetical protein